MKLASLSDAVFLLAIIAILILPACVGRPDPRDMVYRDARMQCSLIGDGQSLLAMDKVDIAPMGQGIDLFWYWATCSNGMTIAARGFIDNGTPNVRFRTFNGVERRTNK